MVWEVPDDDGDYAIGVDIAEGLEHGDRSSIGGVKASTGGQVAHWFGHLDAGLLAELTAHIGKWYGTEEYGPAFVGPERNNHGHAFILRLRDIYPLNQNYTEEYIYRQEDDQTQRLGWPTTRPSKLGLVDGMKTLLRECKSGIRCIGTVTESSCYV